MGQTEIYWGLPVIGYLFLAGVGAGALVTSCSVLLRGGSDSAHFRLARYGAFIALPLVALGAALLVLELGSFQAGNWFRWLNLYLTINLSPMSIGSWLLLLYLILAAVYLWTFLPKDSGPDDANRDLRRKLAYPCLALGAGVAVYTGVLLGAMPARPLWNSPILAMMFLLSAISTGIAAVLLTDWLAEKLGVGRGDEPGEHSEACYLLAATDVIFIGLEILIVFLFFMYAHLTVGDVRKAIEVIEFGGELSLYFWVGVVLVGLLIPSLVELKNIMPRLLRGVEYKHAGVAIVVVPVMVLVGGYLLRYVVVVGGQVSRLAGI